jgi:transcriptional antiterminator
MAYEVIKVYNNNILLAKEKRQEVVLVSKGIGFGKKTGDQISKDAPIDKVFHDLSPTLSLHTQSQEKEEKQDMICSIIKQVIELAKKRLGALNENLEVALQDHIEFAIDRIELGMPIQNPFIDEIISLYPKEYEIAKVAAELIENKLNVRLGEEEEGFITLHIHSATKNQTLPEVMNITKVYKGCIEIIEKNYGIKINLRKSESKAFLTNLKILLKNTQTQKILTFPNKAFFKKFLNKSYQVSNQIKDYLETEKQITLSEDITLFLAIEVEKISQLMQ